MGFTTGLTGGITLTLSIAYVTILAHKHNRKVQADSVRTCTNVLNALAHDPTVTIPAAPPIPSRMELVAAARHSFVERTQERWNAEVQGAVRWAQTNNWPAVREDLEDMAGALWAKLMGSGHVQDAGNAVTHNLQKVAETTTYVAREQEHARVARPDVSITATGSGTLEATKTRATQAAAAVGAKAETASNFSKDAIGRGVEKGKELVGQAKVVLGLAEEKVVANAETVLRPTSDVEKALRERFERRRLEPKTVEEALQERYRPLGQRDNTVLRAV